MRSDRRRRFPTRQTLPSVPSASGNAVGTLAGGDGVRDPQGLQHASGWTTICSGCAASVGATEVIGVLDRLGPPKRWHADEERPIWAAGARSRPLASEDWRLAYLAFGLFLASVAFLPIGGFFLLLPAMIVSRGYVELARDRREPLGFVRRDVASRPCPETGGSSRCWTSR